MPKIIVTLEARKGCNEYRFTLLLSVEAGMFNELYLRKALPLYHS